MTKKLSIAVIGCGRFARNFVELFKCHPYVEKVAVCDLIPEKAQITVGWKGKPGNICKKRIYHNNILFISFIIIAKL